MSNINFIEAAIKRDGWKEVFIGIFENDLYDMTIDTNSGGIDLRDSAGSRIDYMSEANVEESLVDASRFTCGYLFATTYRADKPF